MSGADDTRPLSIRLRDLLVLPANLSPRELQLIGEAAEALAQQERRIVPAPQGATASELRARRIKELQDELRALLDEEAAAAGNDLAALKEECRLLARTGKPMEAIKLYRGRTGLSLRESAQVIDGLLYRGSQPN